MRREVPIIQIMDKTPSILSVEFHLRFFPGLLKRRFRKEENASSFSSGHLPLEYIVLYFVFVLMAMLGLGAGIKGSIIGWVAGAVGTAGVIFLVVQSIMSVSDVKPSFEAFRFGVFFFLLTLGLSAGLWWGALVDSRLIGIIAGLAGLFIGYWAGLAVGLLIQRLGWISGLVDALSIAGIAGLAVVDLISLYVLFF